MKRQEYKRGLEASFIKIFSDEQLMQYHLERFKDVVSDFVERFKYYKIRYRLDFCLLFLYADTDLTPYLNDIRRNFRKSDEFIVVDENHIALLFHLLEIEDYESVNNKVITFCLDQGIKKFHIGIACSDEESKGDIIVRAYQNLLKAKDYDLEVVDEF